jgi:hypothetical protein
VGMGALSISCGQGCACSRLVKPFADKLYPFPRVETDISRTTDPLLYGMGREISVTATTEFLMRHDRVGTKCFINVRHVDAKNASVGDSSRVRVGSLSMQILTSYELIQALRRVRRGPRYAEQFLAHATECLRGTSTGDEMLAWCDEVRHGKNIDASLNDTLWAACGLLDRRPPHLPVPVPPAPSKPRRSLPHRPHLLTMSPGHYHGVAILIVSMAAATFGLRTCVQRSHATDAPPSSRGKLSTSITARLAA